MMKDRIMGGAALMLPLLTAVPAHAQPQQMWGADGMMHDGWGWGAMAIGMLMMVLFWGGVVLVVYLAIRWLAGDRNGPPGSRHRPSALDIAKERYARGEIDRAQYEDLKRTLAD